MEVKVLGPGCAKCHKLYDEVRQAVSELGIKASVTKVDKLADIMAHDVLMTPALVIDGEVKAAGRLPARAELRSWLTTAARKGPQ
jgi:small redox-active disulfide protein 2